MKTPVRAYPMQLGTVQQLAKGLNTTHVAPNAPLIGSPRRASASLLFQAAKKIGKGQDRKKIADQLRTSTKRSPAAVAAPSAALSAPGTGFGGAGYSGNVAAQLGHASNSGFTTPKPVTMAPPAPAPAPAAPIKAP